MRLNKRTVAAGSLIFALVGGGMAFAFFGNNSNTSGSTGGAYLSVSAPDPAVTNLLPNVEQTFDATVSNSDTAASHTVNSFGVQMQNTDGSGWSAQGDASKPACTPHDFDVWYDSPVGTSVAKGTPVVVVVHVRLAERAWDQSNCLNLPTVPFHLSVS